MTRTISLIIATVGAALLFALPAYGDSWGADKAQPPSGSPELVDLLAAKNGTVDSSITGSASTDVTSPDWFERAAAVATLKHEAMLNARERGLGITGNQQVVDNRSEGLNRLYGLGEYSNAIDGRERALVDRPGVTTTEPVGGFDARSDGMNRLYGLGDYAPAVVADDRFRIDYSDVPVSGQPTSTGNEVEWPQVGIGLGVALALILGLILTLKATHTRPFAH